MKRKQDELRWLLGQVAGLPIKITNVGDKTSKELEVVYRINKELCYGGGAIPAIENPGVKNAKIAQADEAGPFISVIISLSDLHPGQSIVLSSNLSVRSGTIFPLDVNATTIDGVDIIVKTWINYGYHFDCIVSQEDYKPVSRRFTLKVTDIGKETPEEFIERYNKVLQESHKEEISKMGFIQRMKQHFLRNSVIGEVGLVLINKRKRTEKILKVEGHNIRIHGISQNDLKIYKGVQLTYGFFFPWP